MKISFILRAPTFLFSFMQPLILLQKQAVFRYFCVLQRKKREQQITLSLER
jgi:hypothetical protein